MTTYVIYNNNTCKNKPQKRNNIKLINDKTITNLNFTIMNHNLNYIYSNINLNEVFSHFMCDFTNLFNENVPLIPVKTNSRKNPGCTLGYEVYKTKYSGKYCKWLIYKKYKNI